MHPKILFILLGLIPSSISLSQNTFKKSIPVGASDEVGYDVIQTPDKGFMVAGYNTLVSNSVWKSCLTSIDSAGNFSAKYDFGSGNDNGIYRFKKNPDGSYIAVGYTFNSSLNNYQLYVLKLSSAFTLQWEKEIAVTPFTWSEEPVADILQAGNGNYVLAGSDVVSFSEQYAFVAALSPLNGDTLWTKRFTQNGYSYKTRSIAEDKEGNLVLAGSATNNSTSVNNVLLIKLDSSGNKLWDKLLGGSANQIGNAVKATENGYIAAGKKLGNGWEAILLKTDTAGSLKWTKTYGDGNSAYDDIFDVDQTPDQGYAVTGYVGGSGNNKEAYLVKTDSAGNKQWSKTYGNSSAQDIGYSLKTTSDGGFVISGYTATNNLWDIFLVKTDARGNENCNNFPAPVCTVPDTVFSGTVVPFNAAITGGNGVISYTWTGTGGFNSTAQSPTFSYGIPGTYYYFLETKDANNCYGLAGGKIHVVTGSGVKNLAIEKQPFTISPVPFEKSFEISFTETISEKTTITLFNAIGEILWTESLEKAMAGETLFLNPRVSAGVYFYKINAGNKEYRGKIVKGI